MGMAIKRPVPDQVKPPTFVILTSGHSTLRPERQSARMSKITNDSLTQSGTGCFMVPYGNSGRQRVYNPLVHGPEADISLIGTKNSF